LRLKREKIKAAQAKAAQAKAEREKAAEEKAAEEKAAAEKAAAEKAVRAQAVKKRQEELRLRTEKTKADKEKAAAEKAKTEKADKEKAAKIKEEAAARAEKRREIKKAEIEEKAKQEMDEKKTEEQKKLIAAQAAAARREAIKKEILERKQQLAAKQVEVLSSKLEGLSGLPNVIPRLSDPSELDETVRSVQEKMKEKFKNITVKDIEILNVRQLQAKLLKNQSLNPKQIQAKLLEDVFNLSFQDIYSVTVETIETKVYKKLLELYFKNLDNKKLAIYNEELFKFILRIGKNIVEYDKTGVHTVLQLCTRENLTNLTSIQKGFEDATKLVKFIKATNDIDLLREYINAVCRCGAKYTSLHFAAHTDKYDEYKELYNKSLQSLTDPLPSLNYKDHNAYTPQDIQNRLLELDVDNNPNNKHNPGADSLKINGSRMF
ncbi:MAG: hypothetical protein ACR2HS_00070, partial [Gammaproteobacteria bacterium]